MVYGMRLVLEPLVRSNKLPIFSSGKRQWQRLAGITWKEYNETAIAGRVLMLKELDMHSLSSLSPKKRQAASKRDQMEKIEAQQ